MRKLNLDHFVFTMIILFVICLIAVIVIGSIGRSYNNLLSPQSFMIHDILSKDKPVMCQYPNCTSNASHTLVGDDIYLDDSENKRTTELKRLNKIPNSANLSIGTDSFSYTSTDKKKYTSTDTYIVPQGDGSLKLEDRTTTNEITVKGSENIVYLAFFYGVYCDEHTDVAKTTFNNELLDFSNSPSMTALRWIGENNVLVCGILFGVFAVPTFIITVVVSFRAYKKEHPEEF